ncbi:MAG: hypothetical protein IJX27_02820 [Clostridia bacterium]|nr:hypothetical protein [Clostridia bacterium]
MKKLISLLIAIALVLSFAACTDLNASTSGTTSTTGSANNTGTTQTTQTTQATTTASTTQTTQTTASEPVIPTKIEAAALVKKAIESFFAANSFEAVMDVNMTMGYGGMTVTNSVKSEVSASSLDKTPVWRELCTMIEMGEAEVSEVYFANGSYYVSEYGFYGKVPNTAESEEAFGWKESYEMFLAEVPAKKGSTNTAAYINSVNVLPDGSVEISVDTLEEAVMFSAIVDDLTESLVGEDEDGVTTTVSAPKETVTIIIDKNGNLKQYSSVIELTVTASMQGFSQIMTITMDVDTEFEKIGEAVTVEAPAKPLEDYVETTKDRFAETFAKLAYDKFSEVKDLEAELYTYIEMDMGFATTEVEMMGKFYGKDYKGETPVVREMVKMTIGTADMTADMYYKDGFYYISSNGQMLKLTKDEYKELYGNEETDTNDEVLAYLESATSELSEIYLDSATGDRCILLYADEQTFELYFAKHIADTKKLLAGESATTNVLIYAPEISVTISKEGKLVSCYVAYYISMTLETEPGKTVDVMASVYDEFEVVATENVSVPAPGNLGSYQSPSAEEI